MSEGAALDPLVIEGGADHLDDLVALEHEARAAVSGQRGGERWLQEHPPCDWSRLLDRHDHAGASTQVLVAVVDDVPVGYLVLDHPADDVARVDQVWVTPMARELGFGDAMLATALERARELGVRWFEGQALPGDRHTKNLYERAGITARSITVSTRLDDAS